MTHHALKRITWLDCLVCFGIAAGLAGLVLVIVMWALVCA